MNEVAYAAITRLMDAHGIQYANVSHVPCKTSEESQAARASAGYPGVIGSKAILAKLYFKSGERFATIVLPGNHLLNKDKLIELIPDLKKMRFATTEELTQLAGVVPGCMPPFASPIFPDIPLLIIASALTATDRIGFNAAYLEKSIIVSTQDYLSVVTPAYVVDCSVPK